MELHLAGKRDILMDSLMAHHLVIRLDYKKEHLTADCLVRMKVVQMESLMEQSWEHQKEAQSVYQWGFHLGIPSAFLMAVLTAALSVQRWEQKKADPLES